MPSQAPDSTHQIGNGGAIDLQVMARCQWQVIDPPGAIYRRGQLCMIDSSSDAPSTGSRSGVGASRSAGRRAF